MTPNVLLMRKSPFGKLYKNLAISSRSDAGQAGRTYYRAVANG